MDGLELPKQARPRHVAIPAAILAALWFAMLTVGAGPMDEQVLASIYVGADPLLVPVARTFTVLGDPEVVIALSIVGGLALWHLRGWRYGLAVFLVTLSGRLLVTGQKYGIERFRPDDHAHLVNVSTPSFPSGHAAGSMIVYLTLALALTRPGSAWKWPAISAALLLSFLVGLSRMMLGVHWPTDVIGGWAFGLLWVIIALPLAERLSR